MKRLAFFSLSQKHALASALLVVALAPNLALGQGGMLRQIVGGPGLDIDVAPSPDGKQLAYASSRGGSLEIWLRDVDGGPLQQITTSSRNSVDRFPNFLPDGRTIVFQSDRSGGVRNVWSIDLMSRALAQLTSFTDGGGASHPTVSPDGKNICFTRTTATGTVAIWVIGVDGRSARELSIGVDCAWLPDGRVVFSRPSNLQNPQRYDIWTIGLSGDPGRALLTTPQPWVRNPVPTRDGRLIAYTVYEMPPSGDIQEVSGGFQINPRVATSIWLASIAEPNQPHRQVVTGSFNSYMSWTLDGRQLLFTSTRSGSADVWGIEIDRR